MVRYVDTKGAAAVRARLGARLIDRIRGSSLEVIDPEGDVASALAALRSDPNVAYAEPNYIYEINEVVPDDPRFTDLWGMSKIGMPTAWETTRGSSDVLVAIVDSGVAMHHPDLSSNIWTNPGETGSGKEGNGVDDDGNGFVDDWRGWDWVQDDNQPGDLLGHGSHVAGIIGAQGNDGFGIAGVNWDVGLLPLRGLDFKGVGTSADIAAAFVYASAMGADVVNASFGGTGHSLAILEAMTNAPETLFVVAAGNEGTSNDLQPQYPCNYRLANLLCVAASDRDDKLADFSNHGAVSVDLAAPGVGILSAAPALTTTFSEGFETDIGSRWAKGGTNNLWTRAVDIQGGYLSDSPGIGYLNDTDAWIATESPFSLADQEDCSVHYSVRLALEDGDGLILEMSRDAVTWTRLGAWTGSSGGRWREVSEEAGAFDGAPEAFLRFRLRTNSSGTADGADIDDLRVRCRSTSYSGREFFTASGTSMAAPHVAGVAALLEATNPTATVAEITTAILTGVDTSASLLGKVATSGRLNAGRALESLTASGAEEEPSPDPEPDPVESPPVATEHQRTITIRLSGALVVAGRVRTEGDQACVAGVQVRIKRNGSVIRRAVTDEVGRYRVRVRPRRGRYTAVAPPVRVSEVPPVDCLRTTSLRQSP